MPETSITIDNVAASGTTLTAEVTPSPTLRRFFTGEQFRTEYDVDVSEVPEGILAIPVLAQVCPVAWARGATVSVPTVDERFRDALEDVEETLRSMHDFLDGGELVAQTVDTAVDTDRDGGDSGLLFTGGVDSTCSYVRHREAEPTLISIRGWTISNDPTQDRTWDHHRGRVATFADERGLETAFLASNMLSFLDHPMLLAHYKRHVDGAWYSSVGHGLGLLGLCAPMAHARGIDDLYMAATHWEGIDLEWGSRPDVDGNVRWGETRCHHDGYELTRQERIDEIAAYARETGIDVELQTCNDRMDTNCSRCEKCYRTAVGLRLSGLDPNDHGYRFTDDDYRTVREAFLSGAWTLGEDERLMWADIRERTREVEPSSPAERAFFAWLQEIDLESLVDESGPPLRNRALRAVARNLPTPVYRTLYAGYSRGNAYPDADRTRLGAARSRLGRRAKTLTRLSGRLHRLLVSR